MTICVTPPPRFPQPAVVALAVPTQLGANITDVWYCVMTNEAPMAPMASRNNRNVSYDWARPMPITGMDPRTRTQVYVSRGPNRSHIQPTANRARTVNATEAMIVLPTCAAVRCNSSRTTAMSGAMPNQAKKQRKKANQLM